MKQGLLWYDDSPHRDLAEKVKTAARRHKHKFGTAPNLCYVNPSALHDIGPHSVNGVRVASLPTVLQHHFWVGVEGKPELL